MSYAFNKPERPVSRVFVHCSASDNPAHDTVATIEQWHRENGWAGVGYHFFIRRDGTLELGRDPEKVPAAQEQNNTGTIAICLHGLAVEKFAEAQFTTLRELCHQINAAYDGKLTFHGHCEVSAKTCPVFVYRDVLGLDADGRLPAAASGAAAGTLAVPTLKQSGLEVLSRKSTVLRLGSKGDLVKSVQQSLARLNYFTGAIDGDFGPRTQAAVLAFQADNHLIADGMFGPLSREVLADAKPRKVAPQRRRATLLGLASGGSRIAKASILNSVAGTLLGGGGAVAMIDQLTGAVSEITGQADAVERLFADHGAVGGGVILLAGLFIAWQSWRSGRARLEDHRTGKTA